ncbi:MAG: rhomboid family intramembrane serine protease [Halobacteriovoraceae bacterium]|nr:rhomboid family intramembrane serine protease [Halobacteriovoraceae bacterium]MCB9095588.1 rhomboid family intramembrane serine protease [Halobacteriovoraceae bacterium]
MQHSQVNVPPFTQTNKFIVITAAVTFLLNGILRAYAGIDLTTILSLKASTFFSGHIYQIATYPFVQEGLLGFVFDCLIVWFIGGELELYWGKRFYQKYLLTVVFLTGVFYLIVSSFFWSASASYPFLSLQGLCYALLIGYALVFSERYLTFMFLFPMKAKYFCMLLGALVFYNALISFHSKSAWAHLFAMAFSFFYLKFLSLRARGGSLKDFFQHLRMKRIDKRRKEIRIVKGSDDRDDGDQPKYWH